VATSRPETMFGDVALAVNPNDSRYAQYIGRKVINPVNKKRIPVIGDNRVKTDFGSGIRKKLVSFCLQK
jgi:valyl-tRNA synthetase